MINFTATQASMNADGDFFKQAKDTGKITWDTSTSRDSFERYAIAGATAYAASQLSQITGLARLTDADNLAKLTTAQRFGVALGQSTLSNTVSTTTQSAISGESLSDASRNMMRDIVVGALSNLAAQEIGRAVHGNTDDQGYVLNRDGSRSAFAGYEYQQIGKPTQLTLHAILGCGSAAAGGGDCASGAVAGVTGELAAEFADQQLGASRQQSIEFAGLAGGFSTIFTGNVVGLSDSEIAQNIYVGSRVGKNAGENNAVKLAGKYKVPFTDHILTKDGKDYDVHFGVNIGKGTTEKSYGTDGVGESIYAIPEFGAALYLYYIPSGEEVDISVSYGYRNNISLDHLITNQNNSAFGITFGRSTAKITRVPINVTFDNSNKNK